jgi:hypothetical protein
MATSKGFADSVLDQGMTLGYFVCHAPLDVRTLPSAIALVIMIRRSLGIGFDKSMGILHISKGVLQSSHKSGVNKGSRNRSIFPEQISSSTGIAQ